MKKHFLGFWGLIIALAACKPTQKTTVSFSASTLEKPSFAEAYQSRRNMELVEKLGEPNNRITFKTTSEKTSSSAEIDAWFKDNELRLPSFPYHDGAALNPLKKMKVANYDKYRTATVNKKTAYLAQVIEQEDLVFLIYGNPPNEMHVITDTWAIVGRDKKSGAEKFAFDMTAFGMAPDYIHRDKNFVFQDILWAQHEDGILYIQHAHWTYAESSKNMNAYITAIDSKRGEILWRSQPLVANAGNFAIVGNYLITAYAFTLENAMLYALHKPNGKIAGQLELQAKNDKKKFIDFIIPKGSQLFIHAYDRQYIVNMN